MNKSLCDASQGRCLLNKFGNEPSLTCELQDRLAHLHENRKSFRVLFNPFKYFVVFLLPWASVRLRSLLKPIHVFFGASILSLAIASVISGINEKLFFSL